MIKFIIIAQALYLTQANDIKQYEPHLNIIFDTHQQCEEYRDKLELGDSKATEGTYIKLLSTRCEQKEVK